MPRAPAPEPVAQRQAPPNPCAETHLHPSPHKPWSQSLAPLSARKRLLPNLRTSHNPAPLAARTVSELPGIPIPGLSLSVSVVSHCTQLGGNGPDTSAGAMVVRRHILDQTGTEANNIDMITSAIISTTIIIVIEFILVIMSPPSSSLSASPHRHQQSSSTSWPT